MRKAAGNFLNRIHLRRPVRRYYRQFLGGFKDLAWKIRNGRKNAPDGLPYPPPSLCYRAAANYSPIHYWSTGLTGARSIEDILRRNGMGMADFSDVLDFGCGCGRIARHWIRFEHISFHGTDLSKTLSHWCRHNLPFGSFKRNRIESRLEFPSDSMDFIYAVAVFGHMEERLQHYWMKELGRILRPGGILLVTAKGEDRISELNRKQAQIFISGRPVTIEPECSGSSYCLAYQPESYFRSVLAPLADGEVIFFERSGSPDTRQDVYLIRKERAPQSGARN